MKRAFYKGNLTKDVVVNDAGTWAMGSMAVNVGTDDKKRTIFVDLAASDGMITYFTRFRKGMLVCVEGELDAYPKRGEDKYDKPYLRIRDIGQFVIPPLPEAGAGSTAPAEPIEEVSQDELFGGLE